MGGSPQFEFQERTTGVLSGLDGPKLNASRTGYRLGGLGENPNKDVLFPPMSQQRLAMGLGAGGGRDMSGLESLRITEDETETSESDSGKTDKASRLEELFQFHPLVIFSWCLVLLQKQIYYLYLVQI